MFEKELNRFRKSVEKSLVSFFGEDMTVSKAVDWERDYLDRHRGVDVKHISFRDVKSEEKSDLAKFRTIEYFLNVLIKLKELEDAIRGENDNSRIRTY